MYVYMYTYACICICFFFFHRQRSICSASREQRILYAPHHENTLQGDAAAQRINLLRIAGSLFWTDAVVTFLTSEYFEEPSVYMFTEAPSIFSAFIVPNGVSLAPIIRPCRIQHYTLDPNDLAGGKAIAGLVLLGMLNLKFAFGSKY